MNESRLSRRNYPGGFHYLPSGALFLRFAAVFPAVAICFCFAAFLVCVPAGIQPYFTDSFSSSFVSTLSGPTVSRLPCHQGWPGSFAPSSFQIPSKFNLNSILGLFTHFPLKRNLQNQRIECMFLQKIRKAIFFSQQLTFLV